MGWREKALCSDYDPNIFFPAESFHWLLAQRDAAERAIKVCNECSVKEECLDMGMEYSNIRHGIFGGLTSEERIKLSRKKIYKFNGKRGKY